MNLFNLSVKNYFNQIKIAESGLYDIKIIDKENITIETINVNILEELIKL